MIAYGPYYGGAHQVVLSVQQLAMLPNALPAWLGADARTILPIEGKACLKCGQHAACILQMDGVLLSALLPSF